MNLKKRNVKAIALSVDDVESHKGWINDINETQKYNSQFFQLLLTKTAKYLSYTVLFIPMPVKPLLFVL